MKKCNRFLILLLVILICITSASAADESGQWDLYGYDSTDTDHTISALKLDPLSISEPEDQAIEQGADGEIIWTITDENPGSYWVLRNGIQIVSPTSYENGEDVIVQIDTSIIGTWDYVIFATDTSWKMTSDRVIVTVIDTDTIAPVITSPHDLTFDQGAEGSIIWAITESEPDIYWVEKDGKKFVSPHDYEDELWIYIPIDTSKVGTWHYTIFATDLSGNEASDEVEVLINEAPAAPIITSPFDLLIFQGDTKSIIWTITESDPGMYWVLKDDEEFVSPQDYHDGEEITIWIDTAMAGQYSYTIFASDTSGNEASDEVEVTVTITYSDIILPVITSPRDMTIDQGGEEKSIVWTVTESNPDMCRVYKNGEEFISPRSYYDGEEITVSIDTSATGTQIYSLFASDTSGNEASDQVEITVIFSDADEPVITSPHDMTIDQGGEEKSIVWTVTESNPDMCRVYKNGEEFISPRSYYDGEEITVSIDTSATGTQIYSLFASDTSGNEASDQVEITVIFSDTDEPVITSPHDMTIDQGDEGRSIVWIVTESNPDMCRVYKNGEEFISPRSYYDGENITIVINTSIAGTQTYSLYASDTSGNEASDQVEIIIRDIVAPIIHLTSLEKIKIGTTGNITWIINESNPGEYWILNDGNEIESPRTYENGCCINVLLEPTQLGTLSYTIFANDKSGNTASNQVNITVQETAPLMITNPPYDYYPTTLFSIYINGTAEGIGQIPIVSITANEETKDVELELGDDNYVSFSHKILLSYGTNTITVTADYGNDTIDSFPLRIIRKQEYNTKKTGGSSSGGSASEDLQNILLKEIQREFVVKDEQVCYHFISEGNIISLINFTGLRTSGTILSKVEMLNHTSSLVNYAPLDLVYKNLNIWVGNLGWASSQNIANATISFKIEKLWVTQNNIDESSIGMNRYEDGKWNMLVTSLVGQDTQYLYFKSETPGFSNFVVTGKQKYIGEPGSKGIDNKPQDDINKNPVDISDSINTTTEEDTGIPGFNVIANLFILLIVVQLLRKKEDK